mmetsp:Transcript_33952/g.79031  ORF Transcript_33952/g.79031 Transcript_33952/m.79031 type:complete len:178 (+) Transcript_33952:357-890(+)
MFPITIVSVAEALFRQQIVTKCPEAKDSVDKSKRIKIWELVIQICQPFQIDAADPPDMNTAGMQSRNPSQAIIQATGTSSNLPSKALCSNLYNTCESVQIEDVSIPTQLKSGSCNTKIVAPNTVLKRAILDDRLASLVLEAPTTKILGMVISAARPTTGPRLPTMVRSEIELLLERK